MIRIFRITILGLLLAACSLGGIRPAAAPTTGATAGARTPAAGAASPAAPGLPSTGYVNACTLVTAEDASHVLGIDFSGPTSSWQMHPGEPFSDCQYTSGSKDVRVGVFRWPSPSPAQASFKAQLQLARSDPSFSTLPDTGDLAYQKGNGVYFLKDMFVANLLVDDGPDGQVNREKAAGLAKTAASRLP